MGYRQLTLFMHTGQVKNSRCTGQGALLFYHFNKVLSNQGLMTDMSWLNAW